MKYVIVPTSELSSVNFSEVLVSSTHLRYSLDNSNFIVKFEGSQPASLTGRTTYTKEELLPTLQGPEWSSGGEEPV